MTRTRLVATIILAGLAVGCAKPRHWQCDFDSDGEHARFDSEMVSLVFEGVALKPSPGQVGGGSGGSFVVAGPGTHDNKFTAHRTTLTTAYRDGVNTIKLDGFEARVVDEGRRVRIGAQSFDLDGSKKTIVIQKDGTASVR